MTSNIEQGKRNQERLESITDAPISTPRTPEDEFSEHMERDFDERELEHGTELQRALREVERSNRQLELAFDHLRDKVDIGTRKFGFVIDKAKAPVRYARANPIILVPGIFVGTLLLGKLIGGSVFQREDGRFSGEVMI